MSDTAIEIESDEIDLNPLVDIITLLLVFFIVAGSTTSQQRADGITVPPTHTASRYCTEWQHVIVNAAPSSQPAGAVFRIDNRAFADDQTGRTELRGLLDRIYDRADRYQSDGRLRPKVLLEVRGDGDVPYRAVQGLLLLAGDGVDGALQTKSVSKPFMALAFTARTLTASSNERREDH